MHIPHFIFHEIHLFSVIPVSYNEKTKTITIADRKGSYPGMLQKEIFISLLFHQRTQKI